MAHTKSSLHSPTASWAHCAILSSSLVKPNPWLTAHLELRNSTADSESESYVKTDSQLASLS
jgi:hypothetical protein